MYKHKLIYWNLKNALAEDSNPSLHAQFGHADVYDLDCFVIVVADWMYFKLRDTVWFLILEQTFDIWC